MIHRWRGGTNFDLHRRSVCRRGVACRRLRALSARPLTCQLQPSSCSAPRPSWPNWTQPTWISSGYSLSSIPSSTAQLAFFWESFSTWTTNDLSITVKSARHSVPPIVLASIEADALCLPHLGILLHRKSMHRLTARFLLLFALVGSFAPFALAATTSHPHACCRRKSAHPCHESAVAESDQLAIRGTGCCNQNCSRAVTTSQCANPQPPTLSEFTPSVNARIIDSPSNSPSANTFSLPSTRAPPTLSIA